MIGVYNHRFTKPRIPRALDMFNIQPRPKGERKVPVKAGGKKKTGVVSMDFFGAPGPFLQDFFFRGHEMDMIFS